MDNKLPITLTLICPAILIIFIIISSPFIERKFIEMRWRINLEIDEQVFSLHFLFFSNFRKNFIDTVPSFLILNKNCIKSNTLFESDLGITIDAFQITWFSTRRNFRSKLKNNRRHKDSGEDLLTIFRIQSRWNFLYKIFTARQRNIIPKVGGYRIRGQLYHF